MTQHFPALPVIVPLFAAFAISAAGWINRRWCFPLAAGALGVTVCASVGLLFRVLNEGIVLYALGGWPPPWGIAYRVDHLNGLVLVLVSVVSFLNLVACKRKLEC